MFHFDNNFCPNEKSVTRNGSPVSSPPHPPSTPASTSAASTANPTTGKVLTFALNFVIISSFYYAQTVDELSACLHSLCF